MGDRREIIDNYIHTIQILKQMPEKKHLIKDQQKFVERILNDKKSIGFLKKYNIQTHKIPYIESSFQALMDHKEKMHKKGLTIYGNPLKRTK